MAYIGSTPVPQGIKETQSFTATAGQTTFNTLGYSNGNNISVFLNGVRLINGTDYTATNGSDIVLTAAASASDVLDFETFNEFNLVNQNLTTPTFKNSMTMKNDTEEDTDGGRESTVIFQGEQSGGEISTLAEIEASHDGTADDQKGDLIFKTNDGSDNNAPTARSRIDSAGNFILVHDVNIGTDPSVNNYIGVSAQATGQLDVSGTSPALDVNNRSNNGDIAIFRNSAQTVGAIGVANADNLYIVNPHTNTQKGIRISDSQLVPCNTAGASTNNELDLGGQSEAFKDLYLAGGLHIGGTGSANKLEDYEEGEYTPLLYGYTTGSGTLLPLRSTHNVLSYTKVGRKVTVSGKIETSGSHSAQGSLLLSIPFTSGNLTDQAGQGAGACFFYRTGQLHENPTVIFGEGVDYVYFFSNTSGGDVLGITADVMDTAIELIVGFTYFTT